MAIVLTFLALTEISDAFGVIRRMNLSPNKLGAISVSRYQRTNKGVTLFSNGNGEEDAENVMKKEVSAKTSGGMKNALLMGPPLLCKFVVVLVVKFLTDAVVFPLLFLYRFLRLAKNKFFKLLGVKSEEDKGPAPDYEI